MSTAGWPRGTGLNFAPVTLTLPPEIEIIGVDLAIELEQLSFAVVRGRNESPLVETED